MELANLHISVRPAYPGDYRAIIELLQSTPYSHVHADWRLPGEWIGTGGFMVAESTEGHILGPGNVEACLAIGADPPPAAWVRAAAVREPDEGPALLSELLERIRPYLEEERISEVGWLPRTGWPEQWMYVLDFEHKDEVITYVKEDLRLPEGQRQHPDVQIRPVRATDFPKLAAIEEDAFEPLWRHSADGLALGWRHSTSFDVAELNGEVVGFQYSSTGDVPYAGHLVRLTVHPGAQRLGIGSALLVSALRSYQQRNLREASLNTQLSNAASRHLYEKFGFRQIGYRWPVWQLFV